MTAASPPDDVRRRPQPRSVRERLAGMHGAVEVGGGDGLARSGVRRRGRVVRAARVAGAVPAVGLGFDAAGGSGRGVQRRGAQRSQPHRRARQRREHRDVGAPARPARRRGPAPLGGRGARRAMAQVGGRAVATRRASAPTSSWWRRHCGRSPTVAGWRGTTRRRSTRRSMSSISSSSMVRRRSSPATAWHAIERWWCCAIAWSPARRSSSTTSNGPASRRCCADGRTSSASCSAASAMPAWRSRRCP